MLYIEFQDANPGTRFIRCRDSVTSQKCRIDIFWRIMGAPPLITTENSVIQVGFSLAWNASIQLS